MVFLRVLHSYNGSQIILSEFQVFIDHERNQHQKVTAEWLQANGEVERQNRSSLKIIQTMQAENRNWKK